MSKNRKSLILFLTAILLFCSFSFSHALEISYPTIGQLNLGENPQLIDVVAYYFNLALLIGIIGAVAVIAYAGFNMANARGEVAAIEEQKKRIVNGFYGLIILFSSYLIINYINPWILQIANPEMNTPSSNQETAKGICLLYADKDNKPGKQCTEQDVPNITNTITGIEWKSNGTDLPSVDFYSEPDFKGNKAAVLNGGTAVPFSPKSVILSWRQEGAFLYKSTNYSDANPVYIDESIISMPEGFFNSVKSIKFINPSDESFKYGAILFGESSFASNACSWIVDDIPDLSREMPYTAGQELGQNDPPLGNNKLASLLLLKVAPSANATITFYSRTNCETDPSLTITKTNPVTGETALINTGECAVSKSNYQLVNKVNNVNISYACPEFTGEVVSFRLSGSTSVLLREGTTANPGRCQFFKKASNTDCVNVLKYGYIYDQDADPPIIPKSFTLIPLAGD